MVESIFPCHEGALTVESIRSVYALAVEVGAEDIQIIYGSDNVMFPRALWPLIVRAVDQATWLLPTEKDV